MENVCEDQHEQGPPAGRTGPAAGLCAALAGLFRARQAARHAAGYAAGACTTALAQDMPHFLNGLGTVEPSSDVLVTSRVDGHLQRLHFTEGQFVHKGDLLAEIDPRPFEAALGEAGRPGPRYGPAGERPPRPEPV